MAAIGDLRGKRIYLDANVFIYALESLKPWNKVAQAVLSTVDNGACSAVTSELTLAECLVRPLQLGQQENAQLFELAIRSRPGFEVVPIARELLVDAARIRATHNLKLPDAIHAATAAKSACQALVSNDVSLARIPEFQSVLLSELQT